MGKPSRWKIYNRKILVDTFQWRFVGVAVIHFILIVAIFAGALFAPIIIDLRSDEISSPLVQAAARDFLVLHTRLWLPLLGIFIFMVLHNILVSHKVAGPLFRFRRYLKSVGGGDLSSPIRFRDGDYLGKEALVASTMVDSLRTKVEHMQEQIDLADTAVMDLKRSLGDVQSKEMEQKITAMDNHIDACQDSLKFFKTRKIHTETESRIPEPAMTPVKIEV